jgi:hypothetical protein
MYHGCLSIKKDLDKTQKGESLLNMLILLFDRGSAAINGQIFLLVNG